MIKRKFIARWNEVVEQAAIIEADSHAAAEDFLRKGYLKGQIAKTQVIADSIDIRQESDLEVIHLHELEKLHDEFAARKDRTMGFGEYVKKYGRFINLKGICKFMEESISRDLRYLKNSDEFDIRFWGQEYIDRINCFQRLLGVESHQLTMDQIMLQRGISAPESGDGPRSDSTNCKEVAKHGNNNAKADGNYT